MAYISDLYKVVLNVARKDKRGNIFSVGEYNNVSNLVNRELFTQQITKFQLTNIVTESLVPFVKHIILTSTFFLPTDFSHIVGDPVYNDTPVDIVTEKEYSFRVGDELTKPSTTYPVAKMEFSDGVYKLICYPDTVLPDVTYLKTPDAVKLDYYMLDGRIYTLDVGETHVVVSGETYPLETTQPTVGSTYTSKTADFEWKSEPEKAQLFNLVLKKFGIATTDVNMETVSDKDKINVI